MAEGRVGVGASNLLLQDVLSVPGRHTNKGYYTEASTAEPLEKIIAFLCKNISLTTPRLCVPNYAVAPMKVEIKQWVPVAVWSWPDMDASDDVCGICRAPFEATCPDCPIPGFQCPPITGECSHSFHHHCIVKWLNLEQTKNTCPMCRQAFVSDKLTDEELASTRGASIFNDSALEDESVEIELNA